MHGHQLFSVSHSSGFYDAKLSAFVGVTPLIFFFCPAFVTKYLNKPIFWFSDVGETSREGYCHYLLPSSDICDISLRSCGPRILHFIELLTINKAAQTKKKPWQSVKAIICFIDYLAKYLNVLRDLITFPVSTIQFTVRITILEI